MHGDRETRKGSRTTLGATMPKFLQPAPDLSACDREPITQLDRVQSYGFLLGFANDWTVVRASANLARFLGTEGNQAIGMPAERVLAQTALHDIRNRLVMLQPPDGTERLFGVRLGPDHRLFDLALHYAGDILVIEGEPCGADPPTGAAILVRSMVARLQTQPSLTGFFRDAARQVRALTGFDRTMIYRFAQDGSGEVIAESIKGTAESWLGLHYPATDIPVQARALYLRAPFRIIADVNAAAVDLLPAVSGVTAALDLSLAVTRAVSPVHIEYLRNMGVAASLSISIIVDGKLWGLVACHHGEPRLPSFVMRSAAELFGAMLSLTLEGRLRTASLVDEDQARALAERILLSVGSTPDLLGNPDWLLSAIGDLIPCDGLAVYLRGRLALSGSTPSFAEVMALTDYVDTMPPSRIFDTDCLAQLSPDAALHAERAAGMLAIPISRTPRDYVMLFRKERVEARRWAGDPNKRNDDDNISRISPRKSFAAFKDLVRMRALPFNASERRVAETVRSALIEAILRLSEADPDEPRHLSDRQELLIAELNHRVRNILALIRGLIAQTNAEGVDTADYVATLGGRVQALARAHDQVTRKNWSPAPITSLFEDEIAAFLPLQRERFLMSGPAVLLLPVPFSTLALVVHELVTNSLKYGALSGSGSVTVAIERREGQGLSIAWRETGGPPVSPPARRGFGSVIVERTIPFDLGGTSEVRYPQSGFEADFFLPDRHVAGIIDLVVAMPISASEEVGRETLPNLRPLNGRTALVLEDNLIVAMEAENLLYDLGATHVWSASSILEANAITDSERVDFAMLDINIGRETSISFADRLHGAGIPYFFASGYGEDAGVGTSQRHSVVVRKPYGIMDLRNATAKVLGEAPRCSPMVEYVPALEGKL